MKYVANEMAHAAIDFGREFSDRYIQANVEEDRSFAYNITKRTLEGMLVGLVAVGSVSYAKTIAKQIF